MRNGGSVRCPQRSPPISVRASCATCTGRPDRVHERNLLTCTGHIDRTHETTESPWAAVVILAARGQVSLAESGAVRTFTGRQHRSQFASTSTCRSWTNFREFRSTPSRRGVSQNDTPLRLTRISNCKRTMQPLSITSSCPCGRSCTPLLTKGSTELQAVCSGLAQL